MRKHIFLHATAKRRLSVPAVLWSSCLAMLAVGANSTAIMAALPTMRSELSLSPAGLQWAVNAYLVASAACIVLGGQAADRFGGRLASLAGLTLFALASCIIATAATETALLAGRSLQGLAAAFAVPSTLAAVDASAAPERRGAAIGAWTGFLMLGFSIGPLLGGALTHVTGWRVIFWLNVLLMLAAFAGLASARSMVLGVAIGSLSMFSIMSLLLYFNLDAQSRDGLGLTALEAGALLLPLSVALLALALSASAVAARVRLRNAMTAGMALIVIASAVIAAAVAMGDIVLLVVGLLAMGAGLALPYASAPRLALSVLAPAQAGQGSGIVNACTFLGGSGGVAIGAIAFASGGFIAVLTMIALAGVVGAVLARGIAEPQ